MLTKTETRQWGKRRSGTAGAQAAEAGLVLLYAPDFKDLPAVVALRNDTLVIGRTPPPGGLCIPHRAVSGLHVRLARREDEWTVKDLGSRNGTLLNGRLVTEATLQDLDELRIGDAIFKFVPDEASAYEPYSIDGSGPDPDPDLIGGNQIRAALREVAAVAATPLSVIVQGETGTGKELVARAVHRASGRRGQLVALNCAAIPANLVESELFGFKRGAFTGADRDKVGLVKMAHGGTLFLDEIGDMPLDAQSKLLRVIETRELLPLGATSGEAVDVRFVCATHRDLQKLVDAERFRGDLFARLHGSTVRLPALRERKEDLYALVRHFLEDEGWTDARVGVSFMASACHYDWPYNVRELEAAVRRAVAVAKAPELTADDLPETVREQMRDYGTAPAPPVAQPRQGPPTPDELRALLARHGGNVAAVAREVGRDRAQVHRWMRYAAIDPQDYRVAAATPGSSDETDR
jgi:DNA-binding NtrC family response regulator